MIEAFAAQLAGKFGGRLVHLGDDVDAGDVVLVDDLRDRDLPGLVYAMEQAAAAVVAGTGTLEELERRVNAADLTVLFAGWAGRFANSPRDTPIAILDRTGAVSPAAPAPPGFRVIAIVHMFNEADVLAKTIGALRRDGVDVYAIDDWSTDGSYELALHAGVIGIERFPTAGPSSTYQAQSLHLRVEELGGELEASWFVHLDADERRRAPWQGVSLRSGLAYVDRAGFNCVDHTVLEFLPVDEEFRAVDDIEDYFQHFRFGARPGHFLQVRAWKNLGHRVQRAPNRGHDTDFPGRRPFPYKFLNKHYPFRSSEHGQRKVFRERLPRFAPEAVAQGFHTHYQGMEPQHRFVRQEHELRRFDEAVFHRDFLIERLSGIGIQPEAATGAPA